MTINELIQASGLSRSAFARELGIPYRTVQNWCLGIHKDPPEYLLKLIAEHFRSDCVITRIDILDIAEASGIKEAYAVLTLFGPNRYSGDYNNMLDALEDAARTGEIDLCD